MTVGTAGRHSTDPEPAVPQVLPIENALRSPTHDFPLTSKPNSSLALQVHIDNSFFLDAGSHGKVCASAHFTTLWVLRFLATSRQQDQSYFLRKYHFDLRRQHCL